MRLSPECFKILKYLKKIKIILSIVHYISISKLWTFQTIDKKKLYELLAYKKMNDLWYETLRLQNQMNATKVNGKIQTKPRLKCYNGEKNKSAGITNIRQEKKQRHDN